MIDNQTKRPHNLDKTSHTSDNIDSYPSQPCPRTKVNWLTSVYQLTPPPVNLTKVSSSASRLTSRPDQLYAPVNSKPRSPSMSTRLVNDQIIKSLGQHVTRVLRMPQSTPNTRPQPTSALGLQDTNTPSQHLTRGRDNCLIVRSTISSHP